MMWHRGIPVQASFAFQAAFPHGCAMSPCRIASFQHQTAVSQSNMTPKDGLCSPTHNIRETTNFATHMKQELSSGQYYLN
jgi:hypothetical protein